MAVIEPMTLESNLAWQENRRRMAILLSAFIALAAVEGLLVGLPLGAWWVAAPAAGLALVYLFVGARFGDGWMRRVLRVEPVSAPSAINLLEGLCREAGIPVPQLVTAAGDAPNALSLGLRRRWLAVTSAALQMNRIELQALLAHEVAHLRDGDAALASAYVLITGAPELCAKALPAPGGFLALLSVPLWPACLIVRTLRRMVFSVDREKRADVVAALLTRYPPGLRRVLQAAAVEQSDSRLRTSDDFWLAPRRPEGGDGLRARAEILSEM